MTRDQLKPGTAYWLDDPQTTFCCTARKADDETVLLEAEDGIATSPETEAVLTDDEVSRLEEYIRDIL